MAKICRLFIEGNFSRKFEDARRVLEKASKTDFRVDYFITPGGFINIPWKFHNLEEAAKEAERWFEELLWGLDLNADCITIGVDSYSDLNLKKPHIELVGVYNGEWHFTGKSYPTVEQQRGLIRADLSSHFMDLKDKVMVLGCHDLTIFNPRAIAIVKGWRREIIDEFLGMATDFKPEIVLHHPHYTDSKFTWLNAWKNLERLLPQLSIMQHRVFTLEVKVRDRSLMKFLKQRREGAL